jgi:predicted N-acetyltransferase YhbS
LNESIPIIPDDAKYDAQCEALYARNFGPGRHAKAAARLREGNVCHRDLSMLALVDDKVVGACRLWPIVASNGVSALFLGPIAVDVSMRRTGLGQRLVEACLAAADALEASTVMLVGDLSFFGRMGFEIVPNGQIIMPGPVDPKRLLWRVRDQFSAVPQGRLSVPRATNPSS